MNSQTVFAVVDLETTGTDLHAENRIIQFSCSLVQNQQIIKTFSTDINPERSIGYRITQLTGISAERVASAPTFDQVAAQIFQLLNDTVFVAHNVNFDFPFLNMELQRAGYPELDNLAVDTVTMSQILLPTLTSYRLQDLSAYFNIHHLQPHSADSDATATARLLTVLINQLHQLPTVTLSQIVNLNPDLPWETMTVFKDELDNRTEDDSRLADHLILHHGIVLRKREKVLKSQIPEDAKYPKTTAAKTKLLVNLDVRPEQNKMMNLIYNNYAATKVHPAQNLVIEAPTGIGKSLGYTLPLSYLSRPHKQVIISTSTTYLQEQLKEQALPLLNDILPFPVIAAVLKGNKHYIDLTKFMEQLAIYDNSAQTKFVKSQILVWLTETQTGDLDELHLNAEQVPFLNSIKHDGVKWLDKQSAFYSDDFLRYALAQAKRADFVIINHDYLLNNTAKFAELPEKPYLVIDEAQDFADRAARISQKHIRLFDGIATYNKIIAMWQNNHDSQIKELVGSDLSVQSVVVDILNRLDGVKLSLNQLIDQTFNRFVAHRRLHSREENFEWLIPNNLLQNFLGEQLVLISQLAEATNKLPKMLERLKKRLNQVLNTANPTDAVKLTKFVDLIQQLVTYLTDLMDALNINATTLNERVYWISVNSAKDPLTIRLSFGISPDVQFLANNVYPFFEPVTFTGATLLPSKKSQYTFNSLQIKPEETKVRRMKSEYSAASKAKIFLVDDFATGKVDSPEFSEFLAHSIMEIFQKSQRQTLVLFNSLAMIRSVYQIMHQEGFTANNLVLAQGVHGTATRVSRRFIHNEPALLLGANTFWQGVDFPGHLLENLVIAQLPFDSPEDPYNHARYSIAKRQGHNPFYSITIPRTTLKLRQGIGRLLRTPNDFGTIYVLDPRLLTRHYGETIIANLRTDIPIQRINLAQAVNQMEQFFAKQPINRKD
ncbi:DnaQ family exonuclease DinG family helicase [Lentilactobacillus senioris DSM 24302 = JCM 17472]|uniref:3'-5' exonuclease DinG n=1 Tax=Lentilactobacillus senioris DSM 24302 = JCM 17472 TaxID=1423802 RepID=A0A0R2CPZ4_9LACO|nr:helicase C-terminal domain-containing protein [Lentilactobacillus senioris]KRM93837.1 DnaQ family exonuclease DinG family helicase [Lentilactobacillus senioris DSM 24302 = JCM 17472]